MSFESEEVPLSSRAVARVGREGRPPRVQLERGAKTRKVEPEVANHLNYDNIINAFVDLQSNFSPFLR